MDVEWLKVGMIFFKAKKCINLNLEDFIKMLSQYFKSRKEMRKIAA